jgi:hypothetical protein
MKGNKELYMAKHLPTGALVPISINKVTDKNVIEDYQEYIHNRKGFKIGMLQNRWDKSKDDVIELLNKYQVPGHINHAAIKNIDSGEAPIDNAIFFEEYIYGLEKMEKLTHSKLKAKCFHFEKNN